MRTREKGFVIHFGQLKYDSPSYSFICHTFACKTGSPDCSSLGKRSAIESSACDLNFGQIYYRAGRIGKSCECSKPGMEYPANLATNYYELVSLEKIVLD